ncbi:SusC/RagA family TonB-linked outer membrane protein [Porphyromonas pogonae]|uniref:SusC/RagA family TonB-linked outer membrane protein n=1 Tax=Porphyromonas pogonae TaxID=867595 RepID=UPI0038B501B6
MQQGKKVTVKGNVTDNKGEALIGVSVAIKGTALGATTDLDGNFTLQVAVGATLEISYVGYKPQTLKITNQSNLNIVMQEDATALDAVVVTALGIKRSQKALSYNVQKVKNDALTTVKDANFMNSLNGKVAGVNIQQSSTGVGGATRVVMRGAKSIIGDNNVLYVIDGVPLGNDSRAAGGRYGRPGGGEGISDFNPEDIESISVLTGPSAAALYGASAANGVILINTKRGAEGQMKVNVSSSVDFFKPFVMQKFQNTYGSQPGTFRSWGNKLEQPSTYNPRDFFNTGMNFMNSLTLSTGNKDNQTFVSVATTNANGIIPSNGYYRYNFGARNSANFLDNKLHLDLSANYILQGDQNMFSEGGYFNPLTSLYLFPRDEDFNSVKAYEVFNPSRGIAEQNWNYLVQREGFFTENPYWIVNREMFTSKKRRYMFYANLKYDINSWMNVAGRVRIDNTSSVIEQKLHASTTKLLAGSNKGYYTNNNENFNQTYADVILNINKSINDDFSLTGNFGSSYEDRLKFGNTMGGQLFHIPNLFSSHNYDPTNSSPGQLHGHTRNIALFGSMEFGYKGMLYLSLTGRNDWASQLVNSKEPSIFYPSIGLSGIISDMVKLPKFINYLKLRTSYTEVGSPITQTGITPNTITYPLSPAKGVVPLSTYPFPEFKAERTKSYEFGLNSKFMDSKFNFDLTLYRSNTYNQTFLSDLAPSSGYSGFYVQAGNVQNTGIEMSLGYDDKFGDFGLSTNLTYTRNVNKIKELVKDYTNPVTGEQFSLTEIKLKERGGVYLREGGQIGDVYVEGLLAKDENNKLIEGKSGLYEIDRSQLIKVGTVNPDFTLGLNNTFTFKGFSLNMLITGRFGGIVNSGTQAVLDAYGVSKESAVARDNGGVMIGGDKYDAQKFYSTIGGEGLMAYYTYDATNVRLQELSLGYSLPKNLLFWGVKNLRFSLTGRNLLMIYNHAPFDPQLTSSTGTYTGTEFFMTPSLRSFGFNVKVEF